MDTEAKPSERARRGGRADMTYDVAVIGGGLAGLALALRLDSGLRVGVFSKSAQAGGASEWAQGGIAAALDGHDSIERHVADTIEVGAGLCDPAVVRAVAEAGPECIGWLAGMGVEFTRGETGLLHLAREGGHSVRRIAHVADATGKAVFDALLQAARGRENIRMHQGHVAIDLKVDGGECLGFHSLEEDTQDIVSVRAGETVVAAGGAGKVYLYTSNPDVCTGDGIAMAWRAGCRVSNMEFVQFHPTCLYHPDAKSLLVSEAVRGEGGRLTANGERFMGRYHPDMELAPRDTVARAIDEEMKRGGLDWVDLDISHRPAEFIREHFPNILRRCAQFGVDICSRPIPVVPAAHYFCGGILADVDGRTDVGRLSAIGECACTGLHGANRLASNSLLECAAFAFRVAERLNGSGGAPAREFDAWDESRVKESPEEVMVSHDWDELRRLMWNYVGIARSDERLERARRRIEILREEAEDYYGNYLLRRDFLELRNLIDCAEVIVRSAMRRRESRGLHYNSSCPHLAAEARPTILCPPGFAEGFASSAVARRRART